jgi:hypothetical protein
MELDAVRTWDRRLAGDFWMNTEAPSSDKVVERFYRCSAIESAELVAVLMRAGVKGQYQYLGRTIMLRLTSGTEKADEVIRKWAHGLTVRGGGGWHEF